MTERAPILSTGARIRNQIVRYVWFGRWFAGDALWRFRYRVCYIGLANFLGVSGQVGAFAVAYLYARALETNQTFDYLGFEVAPRESLAILASVTVVIVAMLVVSSVLTWHSRINAIDLARIYTQFCAQRTYALASHLPQGLGEGGGEVLGAGELGQFTGRYARYCGLAVRFVVNGLNNLLGVVFAAGAMAYLDPVVSLSIAVILTVTLVFYYKISLKGIDFRGQLERKARKAGQERGILAKRMEYLAADIDPADREMEDIFARGANYEFGRAFAGSRNVIETSSLVSQVTTAASLAVIFIILGSKALLTQTAWSDLFAFLVALQYFSSKLVGAGRMFISVNRFYPSIRQYATFVTMANKGRSLVPVLPTADTRLVLDRKALAGNVAALELSPGDRALLILPFPLSRGLTGGLARDLRVEPNGQRDSILAKLWFVTADGAPSSGTIREVFGLPAEMSGRELKRRLAAMGCAATAIKAIPDSLDEPLVASTKRRLGAQGYVAIATLAAAESRAAIVVLDRRALSTMGESMGKCALDLLSDRFIFFAHDDFPDALAVQGAKAVLFSDGSGILGWIDSSSLPLPSDLHNKIEGHLRAWRKKKIRDSQDLIEEELLEM